MARKGTKQEGKTAAGLWSVICARHLNGLIRRRDRNPAVAGIQRLCLLDMTFACLVGDVGPGRR